MLESRYQAKLIKKLEEMFPGCFIQKNDPDYRQGVPDLLILFGGRWAMLEVKSSADAENQPNQEYYIALLNEMWFAAFIYPENERAVLHDLQLALSPTRAARIPEPEQIPLDQLRRRKTRTNVSSVDGRQARHRPTRSG